MVCFELRITDGKERGEILFDIFFVVNLNLTFYSSYLNYSLQSKYILRGQRGKFETKFLHPSQPFPSISPPLPSIFFNSNIPLESLESSNISSKSRFQALLGKLMLNIKNHKKLYIHHTSTEPTNCENPFAMAGFIVYFATYRLIRELSLSVSPG